MPKSLIDSPRYKSFVQARDLALEKIHQNAQMSISGSLYEALNQIDGLASMLALRSHQRITTAHPLSKQFEVGVDSIFTQLFHRFVSIAKHFRKNVFTLTYSSELEALGQATQRKNLDITNHDFNKKKLAQANSTTLEGQSFEHRIWYDLLKLRQRLTSAFSLALIQGLKPEEVLAKIRQSHPEIQSYKRAPRTLKPLREADSYQDMRRSFYDYDFISDEDWNDAVDSYTSELPPSRFDNEAIEGAEYYKYNWELEKDLTEQFVKDVREGQVEAANDVGIKEFVWIAIIDDKTDDCCLSRNGKTTSEIERGMESGEIDQDDCDAINPPAHFNCRCQLAPVANIDQVDGPDWASFEDWLNS